MRPKNKGFVLTNLKCGNCERTMMIPRRIGRQKQKGHIKDMWCPYCNTMSKFVEYKGYLRNGLGEEIAI